jgi:uncharacterized membrane protein
MKTGAPTPERLAGFSDGVLAVIITIMVLDLKAPHGANWEALVPLWPTFLSYAMSYLFVGVFWSNHHHMLREARVADHRLVGANLFALFPISLLPFCTAYLAENQFASFPTALYAGVMLFATVAYLILQQVIAGQNGTAAKGWLKRANKRDWISGTAFVLAVPAAYVHPALSLGLILTGVVMYLLPNTMMRI